MQLPGWVEHRQTAGEVDPSGSVGSVLPAFALRERDGGGKQRERREEEKEREIIKVRVRILFKANQLQSRVALPLSPF